MTEFEFDGQSYEAAPDLDDYADDGLGDEFEEDGPPGLPHLASTIDQGLEQGYSPSVDAWEALRQEREAADQWWNQYEARQQYEQYVAEQQMLAEGQEIAQEIAEHYGREYAVSGSAEDGSLLALADQLHNAAEWEAYNSGNEERLARLRSPEGAEDSIEVAAALRSIHAFAGHAWKPSDRQTLRRLNPDWVARTRDDFEQMERRKNRGEFSGL